MSGKIKIVSSLTYDVKFFYEDLKINPFQYRILMTVLNVGDLLEIQSGGVYPPLYKPLIFLIVLLMNLLFKIEKVHQI